MARIVLNFCEAACDAVFDSSINGVRIDLDDFGDAEDFAPDNAPPWGCGDNRWVPKKSSIAVLHRYNISEFEYNQINERLVTGLSRGRCGCCN